MTVRVVVVKGRREEEGGSTTKQQPRPSPSRPHMYSSKVWRKVSFSDEIVQIITYDVVLDITTLSWTS